MLLQRAERPDERWDMSDLRRRLIATIQAQPEEASYEDILKTLLAAEPDASGDPADRSSRLGFLRRQIEMPKAWLGAEESDAFYPSEKE